MTIGPEIVDVLSEIGTTFTIKRDSGDVEGEYLDFTPNTQVTKPFIREFFLEIMLSYETEVVVGDVLELDETGERFLVMNNTPDMFENNIIKYDGVIYKCNVSGEVLRPSGESDWGDTSYRRTEHWTTLKSNCYALLTPPIKGGELDTGEEIGLLDIKKHELYLPSSVGIQLLDRYQPVSGEYYRVEAVLKRRFPGVDVVLLGEDTRGV